MGAGLPLAVAFVHLCILLLSSSSSSSARVLVAPDAAESTGRNGSRTAYHFQPAKNWMNDPNELANTPAARRPEDNSHRDRM